jgi:type II secretory pathway pseudopilin PulG
MTRLATDRGGFALPAVILLMALLTILLTSGLSRARAERQIARASEETASALTVAQSGLQRYFGTVTARPADGDSTRINVTGGYAHVIVHLVRRPADTTESTLYLVRSSGFAITPDSGAVPMARRTIAQFAVWDVPRIERPAALTAVGIVRTQPPMGDVRVSGADSCGVVAPIPGLRAQQLVGPQQSNLTLAGNPPLMDSETWGTIRDSTHIDWTATLSGGLTPDYTTFQVGDTAYPLQLVSGNLTISSAASGTGLLIVGGNLTVSSELVFSGIVLVGGGIEFEADTARIAGMVIAGLNGGGGPKVRVGGSADQGITVVYNSCAVSRAMVPLAGLAPLRNAWLDTWATY